MKRSEMLFCSSRDRTSQYEGRVEQAIRRSGTDLVGSEEVVVRESGECVVLGSPVRVQAEEL
jgi:hypothetical protein